MLVVLAYDKYYRVEWQVIRATKSLVREGHVCEILGRYKTREKANEALKYYNCN